MAAGSVTFTDSGLSAGNQYVYLVAAFNGAGTGWAPSPLVGRTQGAWPEPPEMLYAAGISPTQIKVTWVDRSDNETGSKVYRYNGGAAQWDEIATVGPNVTTYTDSGLAGGNWYHYLVSAVNASGTAQAHNHVGGQTYNSPPDAQAPNLVSSTQPSTTQVQLTWTDNTSDETAFLVFRLIGNTWIQVGSVGPNVTTFTESGLTSGVTYYYLIWVQGPGYGKPSNNVLGTTPLANFPAAPRLAYAYGVSQTQIRIGWQDVSGNESGFKVWRYNGTSGLWEQIASVGANVTSYADGGRAPGAWYAYWVWSTNATGDSYGPVSISGTPYP